MNRIASYLMERNGGRSGLVVLLGVLLAASLAVLWDSVALHASDTLPARTDTAAETIQATLTAAPVVPPPIKRDRPATVELTLETTEATATLADGVQHTLWSYNGTVPGPFIRVRVGDTVRVHYKNAADSEYTHSLNFHAASGDGGGGWVTQAEPGGDGIYEFVAHNPGLYLYHCHTEPIALHMAHGMYGLILVEPEGGLPPVDREYYVMKGEFYTSGKALEQGFQEFDYDKLDLEQPEYVVWNGRYDALRGENALVARAGETVRLYVGNGGPNQIMSFHVVGEIFDTVYPEGGDTGPGESPLHQVQTTTVPSGGSAIVEFKVQKPDTYWLVDHSYSRLPKGIIGELKVLPAEETAEQTGDQGRTHVMADRTGGDSGSGSKRSGTSSNSQTN